MTAAATISQSLERSHGALRLSVVPREGRTTVFESYQSGALRLRMPKDHDGFEANILNTAGGLTGGDTLELSFKAAAGTSSTIASQAYEKVYKAKDGEAHVHTTIALAGDASFDYLPQPTILFDHAKLRRETHVRIDSDSRILAVEAGILGRTAMGETFRAGGLKDDWRVWRGGRLVFADALAITGETLPALRTAWGLGDALAYATVIYAAPDAAKHLEPVREALRAGAASQRDDLLLVRLVAVDGYDLISHLTDIVRVLRKQPLPRAWSI